MILNMKGISRMEDDVNEAKLETEEQDDYTIKLVILLF